MKCDHLLWKLDPHWLRPAVVYPLAGILLFTSTAVVAAPSPSPVRVKDKLMKRGIGKGVNITELSGIHAVGVLTAIRDDSFDVTPKDTFQATTIRYAEVSRVQDSKSTIAKIGKGIGVAAIVYVAVVAVTLVIVIAAANR